MVGHPVLPVAAVGSSSSGSTATAAEHASPMELTVMPACFVTVGAP